MLNQQELYLLLLNRYGSLGHKIDVSLCYTNWSTTEGIELWCRVNDATIWCLSSSSYESIIWQIDQQLKQIQQSKQLSELTPKQQKLCKMLAKVLSSTPLNIKIKERAINLANMSDAGLMMMLTNMGCRQTEILDVINTK